MGRSTVLTIVLCSTILMTATANAAGISDSGPGCGLGKLAWMDYPAQKQIAPQVMMATTNGTFGSQTFGISSGTSGCTNDGVIMKNKHVSLTANAFDSLQEEMAQGGGEHLAALATLLGVAEADQPIFFAMVQDQYETLMDREQTGPLAMLEALKRAMSEHPVLAKATFPAMAK